MQIAQPAKFPEGLLRAYARQFHLEDKLTWQAIAKGRPVSSDDVFASDNVFLREYLQPNGFAFAAAAPLRAPIVEGYAGAIHLYRTAEQGAFTTDDLRRLGEGARHIDQSVAKLRDARRTTECQIPKSRSVPGSGARLFAFNSAGDEMLSTDDFRKSTNVSKMR